MDVGRRAWLLAASGASLALAARPALARRRTGPPRTLDDLLDLTERSLSPEALAAIYATPEPQLLSFASGVFATLSLCLDERAWAARDAILAARGVPHWDDQKVYIVTSLARRHRGQPLDVDAQLVAAREAARQRHEEIERLNRLQGQPHRKIHADQMEVMGVIFFERDAVRLDAGQDPWLASLAQNLLQDPTFEIIEVRGHAEASERDALALSRARARVVVELLVRGGVPAARLTQHGLGASCPERGETYARRPGRDRRVDFVILKRPYLAPAD